MTISTEMTSVGPVTKKKKGNDDDVYTVMVRIWTKATDNITSFLGQLLACIKSVLCASLMLYVLLFRSKDERTMRCCAKFVMLWSWLRASRQTKSRFTRGSRVTPTNSEYYVTHGCTLRGLSVLWHIRLVTKTVLYARSSRMGLLTVSRQFGLWFMKNAADHEICQVEHVHCLHLVVLWDRGHVICESSTRDAQRCSHMIVIKQLLIFASI